MTKVLITGFDAFNGQTTNPSQQVVKLLEASKTDSDHYLCSIIPTSYKRSFDVLKELIDSYSPDVILSLGEAGKCAGLRIERVALNIMDSKVEDNDKEQYSDEPIILDGPDAFFCTLPIKHLEKTLNENGIPAFISNSAGTFVCNSLLYQMLYYISDSQIIGGFIHLPFLPEQAAAYGNMPSMTPEFAVAGIRVMLKELDGR